MEIWKYGKIWRKYGKVLKKFWKNSQNFTRKVNSKKNDIVFEKKIIEDQYSAIFNNYLLTLIWYS